MVISYGIKRNILTSFLMAYQKSIIMESLEELQIRNLRLKHLDLLIVHCLLLMILTSLKNNVVVIKVNHLLYMINLLKAYLNKFRQRQIKLNWYI